MSKWDRYGINGFNRKATTTEASGQGLPRGNLTVYETLPQSLGSSLEYNRWVKEWLPRLGATGDTARLPTVTSRNPTGFAVHVTHPEVQRIREGLLPTIIRFKGSAAVGKGKDVLSTEQPPRRRAYRGSAFKSGTVRHDERRIRSRSTALPDKRRTPRSVQSPGASDKGEYIHFTRSATQTDPANLLSKSRECDSKDMITPKLKLADLMKFKANPQGNLPASHDAVMDLSWQRKGCLRLGHATTLKGDLLNDAPPDLSLTNRKRETTARRLKSSTEEETISSLKSESTAPHEK